MGGGCSTTTCAPGCAAPTGAGWRDAASRQLRWARVVRAERTLGYLGQIVTHGFIPALALGALAAFSGAGAAGWLLPLAWWGTKAAYSAA